MCGAVSCGQKAPQIVYLSPTNRDQEYFLDQDTFQIIERGSFASLEQVNEWRLNKNNKLAYPPPEENLDAEILKAHFKTHQNQIAEFRKDGVIYYRFNDVLDLNLGQLNAETLLHNAKTETQKEANLSLIEKLKLKELLQEKACKHAHLRLIYKLVNVVGHGTLENQGQELPMEYSANSESFFQQQKGIADKLKIDYEIIEELFLEANPLQCKLISHLKIKNMVLRYPKLIEARQ